MGKVMTILILQGELIKRDPNRVKESITGSGYPAKRDTVNLSEEGINCGIRSLRDSLQGLQMPRC